MSTNTQMGIIGAQIGRIQNNRNIIRAKLMELGLAVSTATLDACTTAIEGIINRGAINATVQEGESYTIPAGYHNGSGVVTGVAGGGNYTLQEKRVTPTKSQQSITSDAGYYGLSAVTVAAIPEIYQDVSATTADAASVLTGKVFILADGTVATGTMANNGTVTKKLDASTVKYTITAGYHSGSGTVSITLEEKSVTPTKSQQVITPTSGKVLSKVTVAAIPDAYQDVSGVTATAADVLDGKTIVEADGTVTEGSMANNGDISATMDGLTTTSVTIPAGYTSGGTVSLTNDIADALAAI